MMKDPPFWTYEADNAAFCPSLGGVQRLPSGNTLVGYSTAGQLDEVGPDGNLLWRLNFELGGALGYTTWVDALAARVE